MRSFQFLLILSHLYLFWFLLQKPLFPMFMLASIYSFCVAITKIMTKAGYKQNNLFGFMVHYDIEVWQETVGIVAGAGSWDLSFWPASTKQGDWIQNVAGLLCLKVCSSNDLTVEAMASKPHQIVPPTRDQVFKLLKIWGAFLIEATTKNKLLMFPVSSWPVQYFCFINEKPQADYPKFFIPNNISSYQTQSIALQLVSLGP